MQQAKQKTTQKKPVTIDCKGIGSQALIGKTLAGKFKVQELIDQGRQGQVYQCIDKLYYDKIVAMKYQEDYQSLSQEIKVLKKVNQVAENQLKKGQLKSMPIVPLLDYGVMVLNNYHQSKSEQLASNQSNKSKESTMLAGYYIMPKYDISLQELLQSLNGINIDMIFDLGCQLLDAFEAIHQAGYVYSDLKPENIMINFQQGTKKYSMINQYVLIDFGTARKCVEKFHPTYSDPCKQTELFEGNILFSSLNQMMFGQPSTKDDLESLCYLLIYLLNDKSFHIQGLKSNEGQEDDQIKAFQQVRDYKQKHSLLEFSQSVCVPFGDHKKCKKFKAMLENFCIEVSNTKVNQIRNYDVLKRILKECQILCQDDEGYSFSQFKNTQKFNLKISTEINKHSDEIDNKKGINKRHLKNQLVIGMYEDSNDQSDVKQKDTKSREKEKNKEQEKEMTTISKKDDASDETWTKILSIFSQN